VKYLDEFRDPELASKLLAEIRQATTRPWAMMEVCGGQTHSIIRNGIDQLLPEGVELIHGPGCPVCVTPVEMIDRALEIAARPEVIFCSFGDMLRVPGSRRDLFAVKAAGGDVRVVYSPLDAVQVAADNPEREVVFFGVGFETTAPANAMAVHQARERGLRNFSMLVSHVLVPPAMGSWQYEPLVRRYGVPIVITGFEPLDVLDGIRRCILQLEAGRAEVENAYARAVRPEGNLPAQSMLEEVFDVTDRRWRGIGDIPQSGWNLSEAYAEFDASRRFAVEDLTVPEASRCRAGEVLQGLIKPSECECFGRECTPRTPLGAPMVSSEGACAAYYQYRRLDQGAVASHG